MSWRAVKPLRRYGDFSIFGRRFVKRFAVCYQTVVCLSCLSVCPVCNVGVLWPNSWIDQDAGRPRPWPHCVRWEPSSPPQKGHSPQFSAHVRCGQTPGWINMPLGMEVGLNPGDIVLDGHPAPPKRGDSTPNFGPNGCMDQDAT